MENNIEKLCEQIEALPSDKSICYVHFAEVEMRADGYTAECNRLCDVESLKLLVTEFRKTKAALAAAEECVGHYADKDRWTSRSGNAQHTVKDWYWGEAVTPATTTPKQRKQRSRGLWRGNRTMKQLRTGIFYILLTWTLAFVSTVSLVMITEQPTVNLPRVGWALAGTTLAWLLLGFWHQASVDLARIRAKRNK